MKTLIIVEDGKVSVQVDDQAPVEVRSVLPPPVGEMAEQNTPAPTVYDVTAKAGLPMPASTVLIKPPKTKPGGYPTPNRMPNDDRACVICGKSISGYHHAAKTCSPECAKEKNRRFAKAKYANGRTEPEPPFTLDEPELPAKDPEPAVELRSRCCQAKVEEHTKPNGKTVYKCLGCGHQCGTHEYLPGHEKTPEEIESWKPQPTLPGADGYSSAPRDSAEENRQRKRK